MKLSAVLSQAALLVLSGYQKTRFLRQPSCRFYPSCSQYMMEGIRRHGFFKGLTLGSIRLCKCHPWHDGGVDDVPETFSLKSVFANGAQRFSRDYSTEHLTEV
jgi:putative membrane protein insertion efficiency factor